MGPIGLQELLVILFLPASAFWLWMLADCATKEANQGSTKIVWTIIIVFTHVLGALIYYFVRRPERIRELGK